MLLNTFCAMLFARHFQIQQYADHNIPQRGYALLASSLLSKNQPIILVNPFNHKYGSKVCNVQLFCGIKHDPSDAFPDGTG